MDWDSHRYLECFFAVPMMGAVLHTINVRISPEQILYTINHAQDDVILVNAEFLPILEAIHDKIRPGCKLVLISDQPVAPASSVAFATTYEEMLSRADPSYAFPDLSEDTRATTFYTTGTTGLPKGVYYSHRQLVLHTMATAQALGNAQHATLTARDVYMPVTPMFHVHAWGIPYLATMLGVKQVYPGRYVPDALLNLIAREGVTFSHCVPTILSMLLSSPLAGDGRLAGWKVIIGGSALPLTLARKAIEHGIDVFAGYGMSETCPILTLAHLRPHMMDWDTERKLPYLVRAGRPIPFVQLRIVDADMNDVPHDGVSQGEVVVRSPWLTQGYLHEPERSDGAVARRMAAHGRRGHDRRRGLSQDRRPHQGRREDRRRMGLLARHRGPRAAHARHRRGGGRRRAGRQVGRASRCVRGAQGGHRGDRGRASAGTCRTSPSAARSRSTRCPTACYFVDAIPKTSVGKLDKKVIRAELAAASEVTAPTILIVPGLRDHVAEHWQTLLEAKLPNARSRAPHGARQALARRVGRRRSTARSRPSKGRSCSWRTARAS